MTPRDWFWFLAGVVISTVISTLARAWLLRRPQASTRPLLPVFAIPVAAAMALIGVALGVYFLLGTGEPAVGPEAGNALASPATGPRETSAQRSANAATAPTTAAPQGAAASAGSLDEVTRKLAARLAAQGGTEGEWKLLAESYEYMGRSADARAARDHVAPAQAALSAHSTGGLMQANGEQVADVAEAFRTVAAPPVAAPAHPGR